MNRIPEETYKPNSEKLSELEQYYTTRFVKVITEKKPDSQELAAAFVGLANVLAIVGRGMMPQEKAARYISAAVNRALAMVTEIKKELGVEDKIPDKEEDSA